MPIVRERDHGGHLSRLAGRLRVRLGNVHFGSLVGCPDDGKGSALDLAHRHNEVHQGNHQQQRQEREFDDGTPLLPDTWSARVRGKARPGLEAQGLPEPSDDSHSNGVTAGQQHGL
jgi:hypothetical protein